MIRSMPGSAGRRRRSRNSPRWDGLCAKSRSISRRSSPGAGRRIVPSIARRAPSTPSGLTPTPTKRDYLFDGPVGSYITRDSAGVISKALLFIAMRRGGRFIYALDVTSPAAPKFLWKNLRYAILIIAVVAAIITPTPDALTMLIFMAPMVALYFIGIGVAALVVRSKAKRAAIADQGAR